MLSYKLQSYIIFMNEHVFTFWHHLLKWIHCWMKQTKWEATSSRQKKPRTQRLHSRSYNFVAAVAVVAADTVWACGSKSNSSLRIESDCRSSHSCSYTKVFCFRIEVRRLLLLLLLLRQSTPTPLLLNAAAFLHRFSLKTMMTWYDNNRIWKSTISLK